MAKFTQIKIDAFIFYPTGMRKFFINLLAALLLPFVVSAQLFEFVSDESWSSYGTGAFGGGLSFVDFDQDGWDDLTFATQNGLDIVFLKNNQGVFEIIEIPSIINSTEQKSVLWIDFDNDGDKDFYSAGFAGHRLYENNGNFEFEDVTSARNLFVQNQSYFGSTWGDFDKDGFLDVFLSCRGCNNRFFRNNGGESFTEISEMIGQNDLENATFCASFFDYDNDSWPDIYTAEDRNFGNKMYQNENGGSLGNVSNSTNTNLVMNAMSTTIADFNSDGYFDIYVTNTFAGNKLLRNEGDGTFYECADEYGVSMNSVGWGANFFDFDNDCDLDLYVSSSSADPQSFFKNVFYTFDPQGESFSINDEGFDSDTTHNYANAIGDFNNDGFPDIAVSNMDPHFFGVWKNLQTENNWLKIQLDAQVSNEDAIGCTVELYADGNTQYRYTNAGVAYLCQNSNTLHFGLGSTTLVDSIKVLWPSGIVNTSYGINSNKTITIIEGDISTNVHKIDSSPFVLNIYPNPAMDFLNVEIKSTVSDKFKIFIYDKSGKEILSEEWISTNENFPVDVKNLSSGSYTVALYNNSKKVLQESFIKL